jgi:four helix bundle protein
MPHSKFYELPVWQAARRLQQVVDAYSSTGAFRNDWKLRDQIRSAAASIMANIAEGFARRSDRECVQFMFQAKASSAEVQSHLFVALDRGYLSEQAFAETFEIADDVARQLSGFISYMTDRKRQRPTIRR